MAVNTTLLGSSRREVIKGGMAAATAAMLPAGIAVHSDR